METTITLEALLDGNVDVSYADAVAIAEELICAPIFSEAHTPYGPLTLETVGIGADGHVRCLHTAATASVAEVALILQALTNRAADRVPGGLRYAIGRALLEVEAPPFDGPQEFAAALARYELGDRISRISTLHAAALSRMQPHEPQHRSAVQNLERRRHAPSAGELRQQLREADLRLYEERQRASVVAPRSRRYRTTAPIAACMVAGVALVAAGELSHLGRSPSADDRTGAPVVAPVIAPAASRPRNLVAAPPRRDETRTSPPVATTDATPRPVVPTPGIRSRTRRSGATTASAAQHPRSRTPETARPKPQRKAGDDRDDTVARIRFEWNNPFR